MVTAGVRRRARGNVGRVKGALDVHRHLLQRDVPHEVVRLRHRVAAVADDLPVALDVPPTSCLAVRCYVTDQGLVAVGVHPGVVPDPASVLDALGARSLRLARADEVNAATDFAAGLVSPVDLPADVPLLVDSALRDVPVLYCPVGEGGVALGIRTPDLLAVTGARLVPLTPLPGPREEPAPWSGGARVIDLDARGPARRRPRRSAG